MKILERFAQQGLGVLIFFVFSICMITTSPMSASEGSTITMAMNDGFGTNVVILPFESTLVLGPTLTVSDHEIPLYDDLQIGQNTDAFFPCNANEKSNEYGSLELERLIPTY